MTSNDERDEKARPAEGSNPTVIRSIAVTAEDVVTALEARRRSGRPTVLRVTPPFSGRMRARLHVEGGELPYEVGGDPPPIHVHPERLVGPDAPAYPEVDETADELRDSGEYSPNAHRERHVGAVEAWRRAVREALVDRVDLQTPSGPHEVEVKHLD